MGVQALRLKAGKAVRDGLEFLAHRIQVIQPLLEAEVAQVVGTEFDSQEAGELSTAGRTKAPLRAACGQRILHSRQRKARRRRANRWTDRGSGAHAPQRLITIVSYSMSVVTSTFLSETCSACQS